MASEHMADEIAKIFAGDRELLHTTTFIVFADQETTIHLSYGGEDLRLLLRFDDAEPSAQLAQKFEPVDEHTLRITFVNFKNPLGIFTNELIEIGTLAQRPLSFFYRVDQLQQTKLKQVLLTFYLGGQPRG